MRIHTFFLTHSQRDIEHLLPILGADGFPRKAAYEREAAALLSRCCAHCDAAARHAASETLDEEVHASAVSRTVIPHAMRLARHAQFRGARPPSPHKCTASPTYIPTHSHLITFTN